MQLEVSDITKGSKNVHANTDGPLIYIASFVGMCILLLASFVHESEAFISRASPRLRAAPIMSNDRTRRATMLTMMATPPSKVLTYPPYL